MIEEENNNVELGSITLEEYNKALITVDAFKIQQSWLMSKKEKEKAMLDVERNAKVTLRVNQIKEELWINDQSREREFVYIRRSLMIWLGLYTNMTLTRICRLFNKDHSSFMHNKKGHNNEINKKQFKDYNDCFDFVFEKMIDLKPNKPVFRDYKNHSEQIKERNQ